MTRNSRGTFLLLPITHRSAWSTQFYHYFSRLFTPLSSPFSFLRRTKAERDPFEETDDAAWLMTDLSIGNHRARAFLESYLSFCFSFRVNCSFEYGRKGGRWFVYMAVLDKWSVSTRYRPLYRVPLVENTPMFYHQLRVFSSPKAKSRRRFVLLVEPRHLIDLNMDELRLSEALCQYDTLQLSALVVLTWYIII